MMSMMGMHGDLGMVGMGLIGLLVVADLVLVAAASIKYLFFDRSRRD